jgi:hypothetical protein
MTAKPPLSPSLHSRERLTPRKIIHGIWAQVKHLSGLPAIEQDVVFLCHESASPKTMVERAKYDTTLQSGQYLCNSEGLVHYLQVF